MCPKVHSEVFQKVCYPVFGNKTVANEHTKHTRYSKSDSKVKTWATDLSEPKIHKMAKIMRFEEFLASVPINSHQRSDSWLRCLEYLPKTFERVFEERTSSLDTTVALKLPGLSL